MSVPVITIDGPSASGKGTVAAIVAQRLGFHYLDSGSLYRLLALRASWVNWDDETALAGLAAGLPAAFDKAGVARWQRCQCGHPRRRYRHRCFKVAALPLRAALLQRQRDFGVAPGLVTDGRDMGSVVFPQAAKDFSDRQRRRARNAPL
jgi:cytidylate kinase